MVIDNKTKFHYKERLYHVVLSFYDEEYFFVVKYWGKHYQWWHYEVLSYNDIYHIIEYLQK